MSKSLAVIMNLAMHTVCLPHPALLCVHPCLMSAGGVREAGPGEDKQDIVNEAGKQEIALTLTNKYESLAKDDSSDMKALFVR